MAGPVKVHKNKLPFAIHSSSVNTGYAENFSASFGGGWDITNYHQDHVGEFENEPMQGPFTEEHVGGNQYRHQPLNTGNDDQLNRAEGFRLDISNPGELRIYGPDFVDTAAPRATLLRGNSAKSPVNIRNIETTTGSAKHGNYRFKYETVQTSGRKLNNLWLREAENISVSASQSPYISGLVDFRLPDRITNKQVIVERFNAPGGPEVSSRGVLDIEGEEYAPNNALPYRNILVREPYNLLLREHAGEFGQSSFDEDVPLWYTSDTLGHFHKTNRNTRYAPVTGANSPCQPKYDNWFVQHAIPSTDLRYAWITSSTITSVCELMGYQMSGAHTNRAHAYTDLEFVSSSLALSGGVETVVDHYGVSSFDKDLRYVDLDGKRLSRERAYYSFDGKGKTDGWLTSSITYGIDLGSPRFDWDPIIGFEGSKKFSFVIWFQFTGSFGDAWFQSLVGFGGTDFRLAVRSGSYGGLHSPRIRIQAKGGADYDTAAGIGLLQDQWGMLAVSYDGTAAGIEPSAYFNSGSSLLTLTETAAGSGITSKFGASYPTDRALVGNMRLSSDDLNNMFGGLIAEVGVLNDTLSIKEVEHIFNKTKPLLDGYAPRAYTQHKIDSSTISYDTEATIADKLVSWYSTVEDNTVGKTKHADDTNSLERFGIKILDRIGGRHGVIGEGVAIQSEHLVNTFSVNNGPYQYPIWKQIRTGENPVARKLRESNIISVANVPKEVTMPSRNTRNRYRFAKPKRAEGSKDYIEPPVSSKYKPMKHYFIFKGDDQFQGHEVTHTYANNLVKFANKELRERLGDVKYEEQVYDKLKKMYDNPNTSDENNPIEKYLGHRYSEVIWPKEENTFLAKTRGRTEYITDQPGYGEDGYDSVYGTQRAFWRDSFEDRKRTAGSGSTNLSISSSALNSQGYPIGFKYTVKDLEKPNGFPDFMPTRRSVWPLDTLSVSGAITHVATDGFSDSDWFAYNASLDGGGELNRNFLMFSKFIQHDGVLNGTKVIGLRTPEQLFSYSITPQASSGDVLCYFEKHAFSDFGDDSSFTTQQYYLTPSAKFISSLHGFYLATSSLGADAGGPGISHWTGSIFDAGLRYDLESYGNKRPWYDSYENFAENIRYLGKDMSTIPEYLISENIDSAILENGGNFRNLILSLQNHGLEAAARTTDVVFRREENSNVSSLTIKAKGIKKLLPYNGFYPILRTVQMAGIFSQSYGPKLFGGYAMQGTNGEIYEVWSGSDPNPEIQDRVNRARLHTFLQPFYSPGIMFNTIKAGIAVDWPMYTASYSDANSISLPTAEPLTRANYTISGGGRTIDSSYLLGSGFVPAYRIPFESIIDPRVGVIKSNYVNYRGDLAPKAGTAGGFSQFEQDCFLATSSLWCYDVITPYGGDFNRRPFVDWDHSGDSRYSLAANNFFSEVVKFFIKEQTLTSFSSKPENKWSAFDSGKTYYMDISLRKDDSLVMVEPFTGSVTGALGQGSSGKYFGWPFSISTDDILDASDPTLYKEQTAMTDPSYAPFTPPYLEGESIARIKFVSSETRTYTLREVFSSASVEYINLGLVGYEGTPAVIGASNVASSVDLFGIFREKIRNFDADNDTISSLQDSEQTSNDTWVISTKMETPVLDFSQQGMVALTELSFSGVNGTTDENNRVNQYDDTSEVFNIGFGRGMWSGYGSIPSDDKKISLEIRESFPIQVNNYLSETTASLLQACGFTPASEKIGQIADSKDISETILVIPFLDKPTKYTTEIDGKHFIRISDDVFETQLRNINNGEPAIKVGDLGSDREYRSTSVSKMIKVLQNHVVPPNMNFLIYDDIEPFIMYTLEFKHTLDQQDLADIWQGVMPKIAMNPELDEVEFEHPTGPYEFFENREVPQEMRFMVFKIKKKAEKNYFAVTADSTDDDRFQFDFEVGRKAPEYSYNWPYDFFSLVELAKVEATLEFKSDNKEEKLAQNNVPSPRQITKRRRTTSTKKRRR